jgi:hypothetical protein
VNTIIDWSRSHSALEAAVEQRLEGMKRLLSRNMLRAISQLGLKFLLFPVSAKTNEGMINFNAALERILSGGEKYTY